MRIIAGTAKGHAIFAPKGARTRPTQDRVRESIFNVIATWGLYDTRVLDLYAGTGAMAIEALSRGAANAVAIDQSTGRCIGENAEHCRMAERLTILPLSVKAGVKRLVSMAAEPFDYVFMDPPYGKGLILPTLQEIIRARLLKDQAYVIVERGTTEQVLWPESLALIKEKQYRHSCVTYLQYTSKGE